MNKKITKTHFVNAIKRYGKICMDRIMNNLLKKVSFLFLLPSFISLPLFFASSGYFIN